MKRLILLFVIILVGVSIIGCNSNPKIEYVTANNCYNYRCQVYESETDTSYTIYDDGAKKVYSKCEEYKLDANQTETQGTGKYIKIEIKGDSRKEPLSEDETYTFFTYIVHENNIVEFSFRPTVILNYQYPDGFFNTLVWTLLFNK